MDIVGSNLLGVFGAGALGCMGINSIVSAR